MQRTRRTDLRRIRSNVASFRFHGALRDFLKPEVADAVVDYPFDGHPSVKDAIEAQGVPHTEVDAIDVNERPVGFDYLLADGDRVSVSAHDRKRSPSALLRPPITTMRFVVDVNLGKLARWLRLLGFDTVYETSAHDADIARLAANEDRVVLTRDRRLLRQRVITWGYWVRSDDPDEQVREVVTRFELRDSVRPYSRCLKCNGLLCRVDKATVLDRLLPKTRRYYEDFVQCVSCGKVYWQGPHVARLAGRIEKWQSWLADQSNR